MRLERLIMKRFLTYEDLDYTFSQNPVMVQGMNLTDDGQKSNGSGKSGMQTAIEYCIAASNSRDVRDNELIMFGHDSANIQLYASCDVRKEWIHINWNIRLKGSNKLAVCIKKGDGDWEEASFSNVNDGKKFVLNWFDISKEDLFNYFIINKTRFKSFFKSSNKEKVDLINRFSDASIIQDIEKIDNEELQQQYDNLMSNVTKIEGKIELSQEKLKKEQDRDIEAELKEEEEEINDEIADVNLKIKVRNSKIKEAKDVIEETKGEILHDEDVIKYLKKGIEPIDEELKEYDEQLEEYDEELDEALLAVDNFSKTNWVEKRSTHKDNLKTQKEAKDSEKESIEDLESKENKIKIAVNKIDVLLQGSIKCPSCEHEFLLEGDLEAEQERKTKLQALDKKVKAKKSEHNDIIDSIESKIASIETKISEINKEQEEENKALQKLRDVIQEVRDKISDFKEERSEVEDKKKHKENLIKKAEENIQNLELRIRECKANINVHNNSIEVYNGEIVNLEKELANLKPGDNKSLIDELNKEIVAYNKSIEAEKKKAAEIGDEIYKRNQWATNFKQFRMFVANQSLETIEFHCNRFLNIMKSDLRVKFEGFKVLADGSYKDEITAKIIRNVERSFSSFSGGERGKLLFSAILANRHMINSTHKYGGLDFLSIDEVFEGIDSLGLKYLMSAAKDLGICVMVITHVTDENVSEDVLLIEKVNGVSRIAK